MRSGWLLSLAMLCAPFAAPAIGLEELERMALANNPALAEAQANVRAASGRVQQAGLYPNPTVGYYGDEIRGGYLGGGKQGGFVSQTIPLGGKLGAARRVAEASLGQSQSAVELQRFSATNNVRLLFYEALAAQRMVEVREKLAKLAADATETSTQLANIGQADRPDDLMAEVEQRRAEMAVEIARQNLLATWRTLATAVGRPDLPQEKLEGDLDTIPELKYETSLAAALRESPAIGLAQQGITTAEASINQARRVPIPNLQFTGNLTQNYEPLETTRRPVGLNGGVQVGVELPVFNRNQGNVAAARADAESARFAVERVKLRTAREMASLFREYETGRITAGRYRAELLPRAESAYQMYQTSYRRMAASYTQTLAAQRTLFELEADYVRAVADLWRTVVAIRGFGLLDGLAMPESR